MQRIGWLCVLCVLLVASVQARQPNIIFFLADDLGYSELGCFGQTKIKTPNIDKLAAEGMKFTNHYAGNGVCAPSRCVLMTGQHPGHTWVRDNKEVQPEGQTPIPADTVTIAELLKAAGYGTGAFGKWGLGPVKSEGDAVAQGFDHFYGFNCQRHAHNYYPNYLYSDDARVPLDNPDLLHGAHWLSGQLAKGADANDPKLYAQYIGKQYAPDLIDEEAIKFIRDHKDQPFFCYIPTSVPHLALQVPDDSLKEYEGKWPDPPYVGNKGYLPNRTPRAAYAAMITRMDRDFGRIMDLLKELNLDDDTIVIFTSDNGPTYNRLGGSDSEFFESADGFKGLKGSLYEGGIRVPMIARWPGHIPAGKVSDRISGFEDWLPTFMELAGAADKVPGNVDGISLIPTLLGQPQPDRPFLYREFAGYGGQQFVRIGEWKAIRQGLAKGKIVTELYDLDKDPGESHNVAAEHPDIVKKCEAIMIQQHVPSQLFPIKALDKPVE
ncbi:MAG: sulfatase-like hydrolase/transferase [Planctomycetes bacterium]|nr:sulfatase-like hydrolase/transferase [Planctomycetota bacterium]